MGIIDNERYDVFFSYAHDDADVHKDWLRDFYRELINIYPVLIRQRP